VGRPQFELRLECIICRSHLHLRATLSRLNLKKGGPIIDLLTVECLGETIPIRFFLGGFDLTPTFRDVNKKYSTRYYLSLVLIDEDARRYFKQSEIVLYRQAPDIPLTPQVARQQQIQQQQQQTLPPGAGSIGPRKNI